MVEGMEERDYYQGKVTAATPDQTRWAEENHVAAPAKEGQA